jgi:hypothetical protein
MNWEFFWLIYDLDFDLYMLYLSLIHSNPGSFCLTEHALIRAAATTFSANPLTGGTP